MSHVLEWRERLEIAHKQLQEAMTELITNKNYPEAERRLHYVDHAKPRLIHATQSTAMAGATTQEIIWNGNRHP